LFSSFFIPSASARDYNLKSAKVEVIVNPNGIVHVTELLTFSFEGTYNEVYRQIYPPPDGEIRNFAILCLGEPCEGRVENIVGGFKLVGILPKSTPSEIILVVSYDYYRGLKIYDDISELHFKLWGDEWAKPLEMLEATIELPSGSALNTEYWLHPKNFTKKGHMNGDKIIVETGMIPSNSWYEIRVAFPRIVNPDPTYVSLTRRRMLIIYSNLNGSFWFSSFYYIYFYCFFKGVTKYCNCC
jgi:uncharacterized membrane protein